MRARSLFLITICSATVAFSATTTTWEMNGYQDFLRGRMNGLSLSQDGRLALGPKLETLFSSDQPEIWSVAQAPDGTLYLGTGHRGRLFKLDPSGKTTLLWTADQPEIFAVAIDSKGIVYAATSPDGKVYRLENGKATEYFSPAARYIWALKFSPDGTLFAATGDQGKIFRVTSAGHGDVYYETGQSHVTSLALDREGRLLAGSEPNGILYRITAQNKAFVLYDANLPEIRAIVPTADGTIYAAALGGRYLAADWSGTEHHHDSRSRHGPNHQHYRHRHPKRIEPRPHSRRAQALSSGPIHEYVSGNHNRGGCDRRGTFRAVQDQSGQYRRNTVEFKGRKRLRPGGFFGRNRIRYGCAGAHLPPGPGTQSDFGCPNQRGRGHATAGIVERFDRSDRESGQNSAAWRWSRFERLVRVTRA